MRPPGLIVALPAVLLLAACGEQPDKPAAIFPVAKPQLADPSEEFSRAGGRTATPAASVRGRYLTARVMGRTWLRREPGGKRMKLLRTRTEFGSRQVVAVLRRRDAWVQVASSRLPNHHRGWIPERKTILRGTNYALHIDRSARRLELRHDGRLIRRLPIAVGRPGNETPLGRFAITDKLRPADPASPYGCCALALSGHQTKLEPGWIGGDRLAIHGTPHPETVGAAASLGCMRAHARDLRVLLRKVPLGAPVFIRT